MRLRWHAVALIGFAGGCQSLTTAPTLPPPAEPSVIVPVVVVEVNREPASPDLPGEAEDDSLTLAAVCLERGDCTTAAAHVERYVERHPEQIMFRAQLGELLLRARKDAAAKCHYERFVAEAQGATGPIPKHLVHSHTRLMEIAHRAGDRTGELFHRAVGLVLLVKEQDATPATRDDEFREEMLCKAILALTEAKDARPADARIRVYLADALELSGNRRGAEAERSAARMVATAGGLTVTEQKRVALRE